MQFQILMVGSSGILPYCSTLPVWQECGFSIAGSTADLNEAISAVVRQDFDMLLCVNRPNAAVAASLLRRIRRRNKNIPVIGISQHDDSQDMRECFMLGALDYLVEPVSERALQAALERAGEVLSNKLINVNYLTALDRTIDRLPHTEQSTPMLEKLREFLLSMQGRDVTAEAAADHFGFNRDYFGRYFKTRAGMTFRDFHRIFLMEYAGLLLTSGCYRVHEVSEILGFSSTDYFTRVFKKTTGMTPSEFRRS